MSSHYLVHWDGYQSNLQAAVEKQFVAESFVDVTLAVEAGLIKCHRMVLCASSAYFQQLLAQHNCPHPIIFMRDMQYWEVIALVDFMYRGEVSIEEEKLEPLMRAAQTLQIHGLSACLKACLQRTSRSAKEEPVQDQMEEGEDSQDSGESGGPEESLMEPQVQLSTTINKLCELNSELELRPITKSPHKDSKSFLTLPQLQEQAVPTLQKKVVKEEIELIEDRCELSPSEMEPEIQIQSVFSEQSEEKAENSDDCVVTEEEPPENSRLSQTEPSFSQFLLLHPVNGMPVRPLPVPSYQKMVSEPPLYKRYSPRSLEQALQDLRTGRFRSIRACARHHGIPMTTLRYRAKGNMWRPPVLHE